MGKVKGFIVTLEENVDEEFANILRRSILFLRGVLDVSNIPTEGYDDHIASMRIKNEYRKYLLELLEKMG